MTTKTTLLTLTAIISSTLLLTACGDKIQSKPAPQTSSQNAAATPIAKNSDETVVKALQANLDKSGIDIQVTSAIATQMPEMYWVSFDNAPSMFTDKSGTHLIQGQIVKLGDGQPVDIAASIQDSIAKDALAKVPDGEQIIFLAQVINAPIFMSSPIRPAITAKNCTARSTPSPQAVLKYAIWHGHAPKKTYRLPSPFGVAATAKLP